MRTKEVTKMEKNKLTGAKAWLRDLFIYILASILAEITVEIIDRLIFGKTKDDYDEEF